MHLIPWIHSRGSETNSTVRDACEATKWQLEMQHLALQVKQSNTYANTEAGKKPNGQL